VSLFLGKICQLIRLCSVLMMTFYMLLIIKCMLVEYLVNIGRKLLLNAEHLFPKIIFRQACSLLDKVTSILEFFFP
jgi:hypothetical protein